MAQEEPLYDFPEPSQPSERTCRALQRGQGSLRSVSVLDRLLLTVPVWLQLSINPATALHILRREPPGTFLVRRSRTSQKNVLCVRLADDSVPSFVQQFGIREEQSTLSLETSAISFPDLPRLISFYCVSRDVLPFPLELPEAIAKATSHKELESISHMGVEFWNSHLNVRGPRQAFKPPKDEEEEKEKEKDPAPRPELDGEKPNPTLFHEFCPITTRSPGELDCGSGQGALCFINPLFLHSNALSRRRLFKRSLKVRISTESSTLLLPPLLPPPPPPLMPKTKGRRKGPRRGPEHAIQDSHGPPGVQPAAPHLRPEPQTGSEPDPGGPGVPVLIEQDSEYMQPPPADPSGPGVPVLMEQDSEYMQPPPAIGSSHSPLLSPYLSPSVSPMAQPPPSPKAPPPLSPSLSPYQSPSPSPQVPRSLSPRDSPSVSPYQSPCPSPQVPFSLSPFTSPSFSQLAKQVYDTPCSPRRRDQEEQEEEEEEELAGVGEEEELIFQMNAASLSGTDSCSSSCSLEGAAESPTQSPVRQDDEAPGRISQ